MAFQNPGQRRHAAACREDGLQGVVGQVQIHVRDGYVTTRVDPDPALQCALSKGEGERIDVQDGVLEFGLERHRGQLQLV
jgi:hypothetical protein